MSELAQVFEEIHQGIWVSTKVPVLHRNWLDYGFWLYPERSWMRREILEWCTENLGEADHTVHRARWFEESYTFWFRFATDATAFKLRWM